MDSVVFLNGEYIAREHAKVSVLDRGFIFGDAVYEVIPVYAGHFFRLEEHIDRLHNNLRAVFIEPLYSLGEWKNILKPLLDEHPSADQSVYIQVTRGVAERDLVIDTAVKPTVFAMSKILPERDTTTGIAAITVRDIRWQYCHIKATNLLANILSKHQACQAGAVEALFIHAGYLTEGTASNVFIVDNKIVKTPPKSHHLLPGITRDLLVELLQKSAMPCEETKINEAELETADEIWITSSIKEITPVISLNENPVGEGTIGDVWREVNQLYQAFKKQTMDAACRL